MARRPPRSYDLTASVVAAHGGDIVCLDARAIGKRYQLHAQRPGAEINSRVFSAAHDGGAALDVIGPDAGWYEPEILIDESAEPPAVTRVEIRGPLEQRAGYVDADMCGPGWSDGHDAVCERLCAALEDGDVLLVIDSPGGANAGLGEAVRRVVQAKADHGRRITGYCDEMIGSAAYYWAACVCDEIYTPASGLIGSIGARSAHWSEAGALAIAGVAVTHFAAPGLGKVAFASELPLSDLGKERGERDVTLASDAFILAVASSPFGLAHGLTDESLRALDSDCLTGADAVAAGLADGVASIEEVEAYALTQATAAQGAPDAEAAEVAPVGAPPQMTGRAPRGEKMTTKATGGAPNVRAASDEPDEDEPKPEKVGTVSAKCGACELVNEKDAKFCKGCGASMATVISAEGDDEDEDPDEEKKPKPDAAKPGASAAEPAKASLYASMSMAGAVGLREGASTVAVKTGVIRQRMTLDKLMSVTGAKSHADLVGTVSALREDAKGLAEATAEISRTRAKSERDEKFGLVTKMIAGGSRRALFLADKVDDVTGKRSVEFTEMVRDMSVSALRAFAKTTLGNDGGKRTPFEPDPEIASKAVADAQAPDGAPSAAAIQAAKSHPAVIAAASRPGAASIDLIAAAHAAAFSGQNNGAGGGTRGASGPHNSSHGNGATK